MNPIFAVSGKPEELGLYPHKKDIQLLLAAHFVPRTPPHTSFPFTLMSFPKDGEAGVGVGEKGLADEGIQGTRQAEKDSYIDLFPSKTQAKKYELIIIVIAS